MSIKRNKEYQCIQIIIILKRTVGYFQWHGEIVQTKILHAQLMVFSLLIASDKCEYIYS